MKILVFTEGTILMHSSLKGLARKERVEKTKKRKRPLPDNFFKEEIPNGNPTVKLAAWKKQGAEIFYLTSRTTPEQIGDIRNVLRKNNFPDNQNLLFRRQGEEYKDVAEKLMPDILVEDDCESIGGESEMTYPNIDPSKRQKIKPIVIKEFSGIDYLPDSLEELKSFQ